MADLCDDCVHLSGITGIGLICEKAGGSIPDICPLSDDAVAFFEAQEGEVALLALEEIRKLRKMLGELGVEDFDV